MLVRGRMQPASAVRAPGEVGRRDEEVQTELADAHLGTVPQGGAVDPLAVDIGAVQRTLVDELEGDAVPRDLSMAARDRDVVEEDVGFGMPSDGRDVGVEEVAGTRRRPGADEQQSGVRILVSDQVIVTIEVRPAAQPDDALAIARTIDVAGLARALPAAPAGPAKARKRR